MAENTLLPDS